MNIIHRHLRSIASESPAKIAIVCDDRKITYQSFNEKIDALSHLLKEDGLYRGDRALILLRDKAEYLTAAYAVMAIGGIVVPLNEDAALMTIELIARDCDPSVLVTSVKDLKGRPLLRDRLRCSFFLMDEMAEPAITKTQEASGETNPELDDAAMILYTSGSPDVRKGVVLTHRNLSATVRNINAFTRIGPDTSEYISPPLTQSFGFGRARCIASVGGTIVVNNGGLNPISLVQSVLAYRCNALSFIPAIFSGGFKYLESLLLRIAPQIEFIEVWSSALTAEQKVKLTEEFPCARICAHYGYAEAPRSAFLDLRPNRNRLATVGSAAPNVLLSVLDDSGRPLGKNQVGEIAVSGDHVAFGYWKNDALTALSFTRTGWFKTGDFGTIDEDDFLHLIGRKDEMITMAGLRFSPFEVEERIREVFPGYEICVVGVPDPAGVVGEIPVFCYSSINGKAITASELSRVLTERIDRNRIPRICYRLDRFPKSGDRIIRDEVRQRLIETMNQAVEKEN